MHIAAIILLTAVFVYNGAYAASPQTSISQFQAPIAKAGKKNGKQKKRRQRRKKDGPPAKRNNPSKVEDDQLAVAAAAGIVSGLDGIDGTVLVMGGDITFPSSSQLAGELGLIYWQHTETTTFSQTKYGLFHVDGGFVYRVPASSSMSFRTGARLGYTNLSATSETDIYSASSSASSMNIYLLVGLKYQGDGFFMGPELRLPLVYFDSKFKDFDPMYLLFRVGLNL